MENSEIERKMILDTKARLNDNLGKDFKSEVDCRFVNKDLRGMALFDLVVFYKEKALAAFEFKVNHNEYSRVLDRERFLKIVEDLNIPYGIYYDSNNEEYYIYKNSKFVEKPNSVEEVIEIIKKDIDIQNRICSKKGDVFSTIKEKIQECLSSFLNDSNSEKDIHEKSPLNKDLVNNICELFKEKNIRIDYDYFYLEEKIEDEFFRLILNIPDTKHICRYTSINNLFLLLSNNNHCMLGIPCMNDKSETTYVDDYLGNNSKLYSEFNVEENNNCFILSCCSEEMKDNLTLWRLYGDKAQGACLIYEIQTELVNKNNFFFAPISYANEKCHYHLDLIKRLMNFKFESYKFEFKRLDIWKHFFKPYPFKEEKEIRLLYVDSNNDLQENYKWIRDYTNGIVTRIKTFNVKDGTFPLKLTEAIIGPKCNESNVVVSQLNYMNSKVKVIENGNGLKCITSSNIKVFR